MMSNVAMRYCKSEDEILAAINYGFLKVLQNISKYNDKYSLATWIRNILVNHLIDEFRKSVKQIQNVAIDENTSPKSVTYNLAEYHYSEMELRSMLGQLPYVTRTVFNLFAIEGYKHAEIAKSLNISEGTSKWHVNEARQRLGAMLNKTLQNQKKTIKTTNEREEFHR